MSKLKGLWPGAKLAVFLSLTSCHRTEQTHSMNPYDGVPTEHFSDKIGDVDTLKQLCDSAGKVIFYGTIASKDGFTYHLSDSTYPVSVSINNIDGIKDFSFTGKLSWDMFKKLNYGDSVAFEGNLIKNEHTVLVNIDSANILTKGPKNWLDSLSVSDSALFKKSMAIMKDIKAILKGKTIELKPLSTVPDDTARRDGDSAVPQNSGSEPSPGTSSWEQKSKKSSITSSKAPTP